MKNFILAYKLSNPISFHEINNLVLDREIFQEKTAFNSTIIEFYNHKKIEFISGLERCIILVKEVLRSFDNEKDVNKLTTDTTHLMLSEIVITLKLENNQIIDEYTTTKKDFENLINETNNNLANDSNQILGGIFRRVAHLNKWFELSEKKICNYTFVYTIINTKCL
ncbi:MAG: hypothetical protein WC139_05370 [Candidatus Kapaibacterium sp.]